MTTETFDLSSFTPAETDDLDAVARRYLALVRHKEALRACETELIEVLHTLAGGKREWTVDNHTIATTFKPISPKVDGEALFRRVVAAGRDEAKVDLETGEVLVSEGEAVANAIRSCYPIDTASVKPRIQGLRARRIDLSEHQEVGGWAKSVRVQ